MVCEQVVSRYSVSLPPEGHCSGERATSDLLLSADGSLIGGKRTRCVPVVFGTPREVLKAKSWEGPPTPNRPG